MNTKNYFKLFQLNPIYNINKSVLKLKYNELQKIYHPDKFVLTFQQNNNNNITLNELQNISSALNKGYSTLRNDQYRMYYIFNTYSPIQLDNITLDQNFIIHQFELREQMEDSDIKSTEQLLVELKDEYKQYFHKIECELDNKNLDENPDIEWNTLGLYLKKMHFYSAIMNE